MDTVCFQDGLGTTDWHQIVESALCLQAVSTHPYHFQYRLLTPISLSELGLELLLVSNQPLLRRVPFHQRFCCASTATPHLPHLVVWKDTRNWCI